MNWIGSLSHPRGGVGWRCSGCARWSNLLRQDKIRDNARILYKLPLVLGLWSTASRKRLFRGDRGSFLPSLALPSRNKPSHASNFYTCLFVPSKLLTMLRIVIVGGGGFAYLLAEGICTQTDHPVVVLSSTVSQLWSCSRIQQRSIVFLSLWYLTA